MVATLGDDAPSYSTIKKWAAEFRHGRTSVEDDPRSGRPTEVVSRENIDEVQELVMTDRRLTVRQISETLGLSKTSVDRILKEHLEMSKVSARWVPRLLTAEQKLIRRNISRDNLALFEADPDDFMQRILTVDETWAHHYTPESKIQSKQWKHTSSPCPKKARVVPSAGKVMLTVFWDAEGVVFVDHLEKGKTINGEYYANLLHKVKDNLKAKRRGKLSRGVLFHQDNAPSHKSAVAMAAIHYCGFELLQHPPYSPDLAPSDFHLFPHLKNRLSGQHFGSDDDVIAAADAYFDTLEESFYAEGIRALQHRWRKCADLQGDYVEK